VQFSVVKRRATRTQRSRSPLRARERLDPRRAADDRGSKFVYGVWRPVTAIRAADTDLNAATDPDPDWLPLITTPPYPSCAGNLATIGASAARALEPASGTTDMPVSITWKQSGGPDVVRNYDGLREAAEEEFMARIWGGVHYRFDQEAGQQVGRSVAEYVFANFMTRSGKRNH
jgi:hypothetical protein